jgi:methionyl aminopeptidase
MIIIKTKEAIEAMKKAGQELNQVFDAVAPHVAAGITTLALDAIIEKELKARTLQSTALGYQGYRHASCISLNDEVVHGVPNSERELKDGDLVKVDVCASLNGYCADMTRCFFVGKPTVAAEKLVAAAQAALDKGIAMARPGNRLSDISHAIQQEVERHGYGVVRDFAGHGIGRAMHEDPEILNYGQPHQGPVLKPGMTFALEPMITQGKYDVYIMHDGWTVRTVDKSLAAHVEDTIAVTESEPEILTRYEARR